MIRRLFVVALLLLSQPAHPQVTIVGPGVHPQGMAGRKSDANYGPPRVVDLGTIVFGGYQRAHVITEGEIAPLAQAHGRYWTLRQGGDTALIIPGAEFDTTELRDALSRRIEVRGIVRLIRPKQSIQGVDLDLIEDPILPPLPPPKLEEGWPRISITIFALRDRTGGDGAFAEAGRAGIGRRILDDPSLYSGKSARIHGQFRGRNLFGDLPANSARGNQDWVLLDGDTAMWVVGKSPKGDGFKLDLDYKGDSKYWLEVVGKPEIQNGVVYLKASQVLMAKAPSGDRP